MSTSTTNDADRIESLRLLGAGITRRFPEAATYVGGTEFSLGSSPEADRLRLESNRGYCCLTTGEDAAIGSRTTNVDDLTTAGQILHRICQIRILMPNLAW